MYCRINASNTDEAEAVWISAKIKLASRYVEAYTRRKLFESADDDKSLRESFRLLYDADIETAMLSWATGTQIGTLSSPMVALLRSISLSQSDGRQWVNCEIDAAI
ncbi:phage gp6-like head-tail connector protein [Rosenbergiella nectarea]|uniref:phage gp6-like head-tail connector protein n=1 Tax=Rosenbergiella nectarea TaxID=988801 RepID=UPI0015A59E28|nr:phage gp6-like head-tail connector protein [Rosenbergiella nectarea]